MRRTVIGACVLAAFGACADPSNSTEEARFTSQEDGYTCMAPPDWSQHEDQGALIYTSPNNSKRTIAVRAVKLDGPRTSAVIVADTEAVLRGLPGVVLEPPRQTGGHLAAREYRLTFVPPNANARYARRHLVLSGEHHVFHLIETAPAGSASDDAILELAASLREES